jgi:prepilin-type N-terminal cleavage/methylation domain-containing protein
MCSCYTEGDMRKLQSGFTLVEVLLVIAIIGVLTTVAIVNFGNAREMSRDAQRKADLRNLQNAVELYKNKYGEYPEGCNGTEEWSGENGTDYACPASAGGQYIVGLAPEFVPVLPVDPLRKSGDYGYVYVVNNEKTVYKIVAQNSVESDTYFTDDWGTHEFQACDIKQDVFNNVVRNVGGAFDYCPASTDPTLSFVTKEAEGSRCSYGICGVVNTHGSCRRNSGSYQRIINTFDSCDLVEIGNSYAVWGGYAGPDDIDLGPAENSDDLEVECYTEQIICAMPESDGFKNDGSAFSASDVFMNGYNP